MSFNQKRTSQLEAQYSMFVTLLIMFLLVVGTYVFSKDVDYLVIGPIERMVQLVQKISENPLGVEYKMLGEKEGFLEGMETTILLTTITKIGALMRVGFGEAGASIIAKNLADSSGGTLNLMGSGTMIQSIFGFCDVRQFTDTTECLQEEVMLFVNRIAHILHGIVVQCSGSANKNIGDAFLLTWKIDAKHHEKLKESENLFLEAPEDLPKMSPIVDEEVQNLADQALLAFCKSFIELSRYKDFICNFTPAANARLYKRFPEYSVRIGSGLHVGWAIEGAIGSNRKIDASYISPNVNFTEFLESSTKAYGVCMLLSEPFVKLLSIDARKHIRQVDKVAKSEDAKPVGLYTYDCNLSIDWAEFTRDKKKRHRGAKADFRTRRASGQSLGSNLTTFSHGTRTRDNRRQSTRAPKKETSFTDRESMSEANRPYHVGRESLSGESNRPFHHGRERGESVSDSRPFFPFKERESESGSRLRGDSVSDRRVARRNSPSPVHEPSKHDSMAFHERPSFQEKPSRHENRVTSVRFLPIPIDDPTDKKVAEVETETKIDPTKSPNIIIPKYQKSVWIDDDEICELRKLVDKENFRRTWTQGMTAYRKGEWSQAKEFFQNTLTQSSGKDGPSKYLLSVIGELGNSTLEWKGYRVEGGGH